MSIEATPHTVVEIGGASVGAPEPIPLTETSREVAEPSPDAAVSALRHLLLVESDIRTCRSIDELSVLLVNELRKAMGARSAYLLLLRSGRPRIMKASGTGDVDRNAPTVRWLEKELRNKPPSSGWNTLSALRLEIGPDPSLGDGPAFPFPEGFWLPLKHREAKPDYGVLVVSERAFCDDAITIGARLVGTAAHAAGVLNFKAPRRKVRFVYRLLFYGLCLATAASMFYPVPMTALAPMEVVPKAPFVVAAPIDGVIENVVAAPNSAVKQGDVIVQYVDTVPRNQLQVAEEEVSVAAAKLRQLQQSSFVDETAKRELAQARAELSLKVAERDFAKDTFEKSDIRAPRDGIAVYADRKEWVGKPVVTGQRILEIADESNVELRANLPVGEVLNLKTGDCIRAFLNGDPLNPLEARVSSTSHQARLVEGQGLVYLINGEFTEDSVAPRPGIRGTAQLFSDKAPLGYYLFRRPLTWLRQKVGL